MKKTYQKPETNDVKLTSSWCLLAGSVEAPTAPIDPNGEVEAGSIESRRHYSVWDEEEDE